MSRRHDTKVPWRRRGLPHIDGPGVWQSVTFRLADAIPMALFATEPTCGREIDAILDEGHGQCLLADPRAASIVEDALMHFDPARYRLIAWCVMPNHVHTLIAVTGAVELSKIVHSWKSFTSNAINEALDRRGKVWQRDYYDRFVRDQDHADAVIAYIENNPVKAGLVDSPEQWRHASVSRPT